MNSPDCVGQAILTRLKLIAGEWFLNVREGTPYFGQILGENTRPLYDQAIRERILGTPNVLSILEYQSILDANSRKLSVQASVLTAFQPSSPALAGSVTAGVQPGRLDIDFVLDHSVMT